MAATPSHPGLLSGEALERELALLPTLELDALRSRWRQRLRSAPPPQLSRPLLIRVLAYRLQARVYGDLDRDTARTLERIARQRIRSRRSAETPSSIPIPLPAPPPRCGGSARWS